MKKALCYLALTGVLALGGAFTSFAQGAGWLQNENGWKYEKTDGIFSSNEWYTIDGKWYHFDANGIMQYGWLKDGNAWYYLDPANGSMVSNTSRTIDGVSYNFGQDGIMANNSNTSSKKGISTGRWEGKTFVNDWSEYRVTTIDGYGTYALENSSNGELSVYNDFAVATADASGSLGCIYYSFDKAQDIDSNMFHQIFLGVMADDSDVTSTNLTKDVTLGRHTYSKGITTLNTNETIETYSRKIDNYYMIIFATYTPDQANNIHKMLESIQ